ncbi:DUF4179 domain-containing protein [Clostridium perfringens]|nr:DUF4179 domain-containing protein [Clostridium perfringens]
MNKRDLDKINLPDNLDNIIDDAINMADEDKKKNRETKGYKKRFKTIAAGLALATTLGIGTTALAYGIPDIKNAFKEIHDKMEGHGNLSKYETEINKTVYNNGVGVTISEAIYDGQSLYVTYKVESEKPFKYLRDDDYPNIANTHILPLSKVEVSFTDEKLDKVDKRIEGDFIDEHTFIGVEQYDLMDLKTEIPNEFEFTTNINALAIEKMDSSGEGQVFKGSWDFKVPVKVDKSLTKEIEVNDVNEKGMGVIKIYDTPSEFKIVTTSPKDVEPWDCVLQIFDEDGKLIPYGSGGSYGDYSVTRLPKKYKPLNKIRVEFWSEVVKGDEERANVDKSIIMYSKEINLEN